MHQCTLGRPRTNLAVQVVGEARAPQDRLLSSVTGRSELLSAILRQLQTLSGHSYFERRCLVCSVLTWLRISPWQFQGHNLLIWIELGQRIIRVQFAFQQKALPAGNAENEVPLFFRIRTCCPVHSLETLKGVFSCFVFGAAECV